MFSRLKQKLKEESFNTLNEQSPKQQFDVQQQQQLQQIQPNKEQLNISEEKSSVLNNEVNTTSSNEDTTKYQTLSSSDETATSESIKTRDSTPNSELKSNDLLSKYDTFVKQDSECENIEKYRQVNLNLLSHIESLNNFISEKLNENDLIRNEMSQVNNKLEVLEYENETLKDICNKLEVELNEIKNEKDDLIIKNADLSQKYELLKLVNSSSNSNSNKLTNTLDTNHRHNSIQSNETITTIVTNNIKEDDENLKIELQKQLDENKFLRDDLNEKNKMIKNLQQRLNDMKKTLQKELKYQALPNEAATASINTSANMPSNKTTPSPTMSVHNQFNSETKPSETVNNTRRISAHHLTLGRKSSLLTNNNLSNLHDDVNFKYLKHVVFKFVTSRDYEAIHLVKALSVLLNLNTDEEKILKETLEWKMSWFGSRPKIQ